MEREVLKEARFTRVNGRPHNFMSYFLELEHPGSGATMVETYASMPAVVGRAAQLIRAGYHIGISSSATQSEDTSSRVGLSDC